MKKPLDEMSNALNDPPPLYRTPHFIMRLFISTARRSDWRSNLNLSHIRRPSSNLCQLYSSEKHSFLLPSLPSYSDRNSSIHLCFRPTRETEARAHNDLLVFLSPPYSTVILSCSSACYAVSTTLDPALQNNIPAYYLIKVLMIDL